MFNPLLKNLRDLSEDELLKKISTLQTRLKKTSPLLNKQVYDNLFVLLQEHQFELQRRGEETMEKMRQEEEKKHKDENVSIDTEWGYDDDDGEE